MLRITLGILLLAGVSGCFGNQPGYSCDDEPLGMTACDYDAEEVLQCAQASEGQAWMVLQACPTGTYCNSKSITCVTADGDPAPSGGGACCKHCGSDSKPCGDTCISRSKTCHTPGGCACQ